MKRLLALLLPLILAACASAPPPQVVVPDIAKSEHVAVTDSRAAGETERKAFSYLITSDAYGIFRNGELGLQPPLLRLLQHRVFEKTGADAKVTVYHFVTYQNIQGQLRGAAMGSILGPVGAVIGGKMSEHDTALSTTLVDRAAFDAMTGDNEWKRGVPTPTENPQKGAVYVSYLDAEVNGKRAFVRVVAPISAPPGQIPFVVAMETTIQHFLAQL